MAKAWSNGAAVVVGTMAIGPGALCLAQEAKLDEPGKSAEVTKQEAVKGTQVVAVGPPKEGGWPTREPMPTIADAEIAAAHQLLAGSFQSQAVPGGGVGEVADIPALVYSAARVDVPGLDNAVYFEVARADGAWRPFRQGVFHLYRHGTSLRLRMFELGGMPSLNDAVIGLWLAPDVFPRITARNLIPKGDISLAKKGDGYEGKTATRLPTTAMGAVEYDAGIAFGAGQITLWDRGFDAAGEQVFGQPEGKSVVFRTGAPVMKVSRTEHDVVVIDMIAPSEGVAAMADTENRIAVHYTGFLQTDGWKFASSKDPRWDGSLSDPQVFSLKAKLLSGWSEGIPGMRKGGMRRLVIPSGMGFHTVGSNAWRVPPNTGLIFEVECLWVEEEVAPPAPEKEDPNDPRKALGGEGVK